MKKRRRIREDVENSYWQSYSDMMAALLLVFVLIISFTMLRARKQYEQKEYELQKQALLMQDQENQLDEVIAQNEEKESELQAQALLLEDQQSLLESIKAQNDAKEKELQSQADLLEEQQAALDELQAQNEEKEKELQSQASLMQEQQQQLDQIIGVRGDVIEALRKEFDGTDLSVSIDSQTGAITFESSILFDYNDFELKESGIAFLQEFLPRYFHIIMSGDFSEYMSEVIIEGHTDTSGDYMYNLELSQKRALAVANYCLGGEGSVMSADEIERLRQIVTANGKSSSNPVYNADGTVNMEASRRVEFKFRLKDDEMITELMKILEG